MFRFKTEACNNTRFFDAVEGLSRSWTLQATISRGSPITQSVAAIPTSIACVVTCSRTTLVYRPFFNFSTIFRATSFNHQSNVGKCMIVILDL
jgi:hypothetical protein